MKGRTITIEDWDGAHHSTFKRVMKDGQVSYGGRWYYVEKQGGGYRLGSPSPGPSSKKNPAVSVRSVKLKNFTGTVTKLPGGKVKVTGRSKR